MKLVIDNVHPNEKGFVPHGKYILLTLSSQNKLLGNGNKANDQTQKFI